MHTCSRNQIIGIMAGDRTITSPRESLRRPSKKWCSMISSPCYLRCDAAPPDDRISYIHRAGEGSRKRARSSFVNESVLCDLGVHLPLCYQCWFIVTWELHPRKQGHTRRCGRSFPTEWAPPELTQRDVRCCAQLVPKQRVEKNSARRRGNFWNHALEVLPGAILQEKAVTSEG